MSGTLHLIWGREATVPNPRFLAITRCPALHVFNRCLPNAPLQDVVPILPSAARAMAAQLRAASTAATQTALYDVYPEDLDLGLLPPAALKAYPAVAQAVDAVIADQMVCTALEVSGRR